MPSEACWQPAQQRRCPCPWRRPHPETGDGSVSRRRQAAQSRQAARTEQATISSGQPRARTQPTRKPRAGRLRESGAPAQAKECPSSPAGPAQRRSYAECRPRAARRDSTRTGLPPPLPVASSRASSSSLSMRLGVWFRPAVRASGTGAAGEGAQQVRHNSVREAGARTSSPPELESRRFARFVRFWTKTGNSGTRQLSGEQEVARPRGRSRHAGHGRRPQEQRAAAGGRVPARECPSASAGQHSGETADNCTTRAARDDSARTGASVRRPLASPLAFSSSLSRGGGS